MQKNISRALKLYPFYEATSGDLLFFSVIQTLFLMQVKGFSAAQIAMMILICDIVDLALEYPSYRIIRRLGNSRACVIGGILPLIGILLITVGTNLPLVIIGKIFFVSAGNFQSMAGAAARNNLVLTGEKEQYTKLFSKGNTIYSAVSMAAAVLVPVLFSVNRYIPSLLCIVICAVIAVISFFIPDYTEQGRVQLQSKEEKEEHVKIGKGMWLLIVVFCMFFCAGAVFTTNTEVYLTVCLEGLFAEQNTIFIFGLIVWSARMLRLLCNIMLEKILDKLKDKIVIIAPAALLIAFMSVGAYGLLSGKTFVAAVLSGITYIFIKGVIWDPMRTFLRMTAVDTNSKSKQQSMLVLLNSGQSVVSIVMDLIVVGILNILSMEYVFLCFAVLCCITFACAIMLRIELQKSVQLMCYGTVLNENEIDNISRLVYDDLINVGAGSKEAASYRILTEEKLISCMNEGKRDEELTVSLYSRLEEYHVSIKFGEDKYDIFTPSVGDDPISDMIFQNILRNI